MGERSQQLLSEAGENLQFVTESVKQLSEHIRDLEALVLEYLSYVVNTKPTTTDQIGQRIYLMLKTDDLIGPPKAQPEQ